MVPLTKTKSCFVRVDKLALEQLTKTYRAYLGDVVSPTRIMDVLSYDALNTRKTLDMGASFQTDGVQICLQWLKTGEIPVDVDEKIPPNGTRLIDESFTDTTSGLFSKNPAYISEGEVPVVFSIDPGRINHWCVSHYNPQHVDTKDECVQIINLTCRHYSKKIGLNKYKEWETK